MVKAEQILNIINSLENYKGPKWNLYKVYQYLTNSYIEEMYSPYCKGCNDACGQDGCCPATMCNFGKDCVYRETYLNDLKYGYYNAKDLIKIINDSKNEDLIEQMDYILDNNYDLVYD